MGRGKGAREGLGDREKGNVVRGMGWGWGMGSEERQGRRGWGVGREWDGKAGENGGGGTWDGVGVR